jgi:hypothetical protein
MNKLIYFAPQRIIFPALVADVAELADALDSKSGIRKDVWVRPPPSAPWQGITSTLSLLANAIDVRIFPD